MIAKNDIVVKLFSKEKLIYFISFFFWDRFAKSKEVVQEPLFETLLPNVLIM